MPLQATTVRARMTTVKATAIITVRIRNTCSLKAPLPNRGDEVITYGSQAADIASSGIYVPEYSDTTRYFPRHLIPLVSVSEK